MSIDFKELAKPFAYEDLEWRTLRVLGKTVDNVQAMIVPYVTARAIQDRLDLVCEPNGWWNEFRDWKGGQLCGITIGNVTKWDGAKDTQIEALKGGLSDAMKRAAVQWGIGRYLYKLPPMKAQILKTYESGAYKGIVGTEKNTFWWKPNAAAVKAIEATIKEASE